MKWLRTLLEKLRRWKYALLTFRDYAARLNRSVEVENELWKLAAGKRPPFTPEEARALARKLGMPCAKN